MLSAQMHPNRIATPSPVHQVDSAVARILLVSNPYTLSFVSLPIVSPFTREGTR